MKAQKKIFIIRKRVADATSQPRMRVPITNIYTYEFMRRHGWQGGKYKTYLKKSDTME